MPTELNKAILKRLSPCFNNSACSKPDMIITGGTIVDTKGGQFKRADIAVKNGKIAAVIDGGAAQDLLNDPEITQHDASGKFISPGFINTHLHIESSLITPQEYSRMITPRGTTTIVCDPHEAANVIGTPAFDFFLDSAQESILDIYMGISTCVPSMSLGSSGAEINAIDMKPYLDKPGVVGAAEYMDIGGMMSGAPKTLEIMDLFKGRYIGGHIPGISDPAALQIIRDFGVQDDHECTSAPEAKAKLDVGFNIMIREGTAAKNLDALIPIITPDNDGRLMFCTDDRHPDEVQDAGEVDYIIRKAIAGYDADTHGADKGAYIMRVYQMATLWAAENFGFEDRGYINAGARADLVILNSLEDCRAQTVFKDGLKVDEALMAEQRKIDPAAYGMRDTVTLKDGAEEIEAASLKVIDQNLIGKAEASAAIIGLQAGQIVTNYKEETLPVTKDGEVLSDPARDILKIAVIERHGKSGNVGAGFVQGFKLEDGAIASSVGHDDHNIIVMGSDDEQMAMAVNALKKAGGGFVMVRGGAVQAVQPLPICGLMSDKPWEEVADIQRAFLKAAGSKDLPDPTMALAFLALGVIPDIKLRVPTNDNPQSLTRFNPADGITAPQVWDLIADHG